jgi:hypothetical protein
MIRMITVEQRLRFFLLAIAGCICAGTLVELLLAEHIETAVQLVPFALCGLGLLVVVAALVRPQRATLIVLRLVMALLIFGAVFGVYEHIEHNLAFELEIRPNATVSDVWLDALKGASPLLAPGVLGLAAVLALAATYEHPALARRPASTAQAQNPLGEQSSPQKGRP